jgi:hypothetical protein
VTGDRRMGAPSHNSLPLERRLEAESLASIELGMNFESMCKTSETVAHHLSIPHNLMKRG